MFFKYCKHSIETNVQKLKVEDWNWVKEIEAMEFPLVGVHHKTGFLSTKPTFVKSKYLVKCKGK